MNLRPSHRTAVLPFVAALSALLLAGCGDGATLDVRMLNPSTVSSTAENPYIGADRIAFKVFEADSKRIVHEANASYSAGKLSLDDVPTGKDLRIRAMAYDSNGAIISWGDSQRFKMPDGESSETVTAVIVMRTVGTWTPVMGLDEGGNAIEVGLQKPRAAHTATLLDSGKVLIVGGLGESEESSAIVPSIEILDPDSGTLTRKDDDRARRAHHTAAKLLTGDVLVAGGISSESSESGGTALTARLDQSQFDAASLSWKNVDLPPFNGNRSHHTAQVFPATGNVLYFGGYQSVSQGRFASPSATIYKPIEGQFDTATYDLQARVGHATALLDNYYPVVLGGKQADGTMSDKVLVFEGLEQGGSVKTLTKPEAKRMNAAVVSHSSRSLLIMGGTDENGALTSGTAILTVNGYQGSTTSGSLRESREHLCAVQTREGEYMAIGGRASQGATNTVDILTAVSDGGVSTGYAQALSQRRYLHTCTVLENGQVLVTGGIGQDGNAIKSMEIYTPSPEDYPGW